MVSDSSTVSTLLVQESAPEARLLAAGVETMAPGEFAFEHAATLSEAVERMSAHRFAAAAIELPLADASAPSPWRELRSVCPSLPLIVVASEDEGGLADLALSDGVQDFILKADLSFARFIRTVKNAISRESRVARLRNQYLHLKASAARAENFFVESADGLAVIDRRGQVLFLNRQAAIWMGTSVDSAVGSIFPIQVPASGSSEVAVTVEDPLGPGGVFRRVRVAKLEVRSVPSVWIGESVTIVTMRDRTRQIDETTRLLLLTRLDRAIAASSGDRTVVCEIVADWLPRLVPYQELQIAVSRVAGAPPTLICQRGSIDSVGTGVWEVSGSGQTLSVFLGNERSQSGWISVSSRRPNAFDEQCMDVLQHVAAMVTASLGLSTRALAATDS